MAPNPNDVERARLFMRDLQAAQRAILKGEVPMPGPVDPDLHAYYAGLVIGALWCSVAMPTPVPPPHNLLLALSQKIPRVALHDWIKGIVAQIPNFPDKP